MAKIKKNELVKQHIQSAQKLDWDSLALAIIDLEKAIKQEGTHKQLKLLNLKLEIYEAEKSSRVFNSFDMEYFLNKDMDIFDEDEYGFSDI